MIILVCVKRSQQFDINKENPKSTNERNEHLYKDMASSFTVLVVVKR